MENQFLSPPEVAAYVRDLGVKKAETKTGKLLLLAFMAGMFVALAAHGSNMASFNLLAVPETYGIGKAMAALFFPTALMLVVVAGGELFTGNCLITISVLEKKTTLAKMIRNLAIVYCGNFIGGLFIAYLSYATNLFNSGGGMMGGITLKIAYGKTTLTPGSALAMGILCNVVVCLAVWMAYAAKDITGKLLSIFFAIALFTASGYEHCVANMYYVPAGLFAKSNEAWVAASGLTAEKLAEINVQNFFVKNLLPVTIGNIIGGAVLIGMVYWAAYLKSEK